MATKAATKSNQQGKASGAAQTAAKASPAPDRGRQHEMALEPLQDGQEAPRQAALASGAIGAGKPSQKRQDAPKRAVAATAAKDTRKASRKAAKPAAAPLNGPPPPKSAASGAPKTPSGPRKPANGAASSTAPEAPAAAEAAPGDEQEKVVRDTFSFPPGDHGLIRSLQDEFLDLRLRPSKSDLVRAGLYALKEMDAENRKRIMQALRTVKTGRPTGRQA